MAEVIAFERLVNKSSLYYNKSYENFTYIASTVGGLLPGSSIMEEG